MSQIAKILDTYLEAEADAKLANVRARYEDDANGADLFMKALELTKQAEDAGEFLRQLTRSERITYAANLAEALHDEQVKLGYYNIGVEAGKILVENDIDPAELDKLSAAESEKIAEWLSAEAKSRLAAASK